MKLTHADFVEAAARIAKAAGLPSCPAANIFAVVQVETPAPHVGDSARGPLILNEAHKFYKLSGRLPVSRDYPALARRTWTPSLYCKGRTWEVRQACEHDKLRTKCSIYGGQLREAALKSVSMGLFQVLGENHAMIGFPTVSAMWARAAVVDDRIDLFEFFVPFVIRAGLARALCLGQWATFARGYNGPGYKRNNYDVLLARAARAYRPTTQVAALLAPLPLVPTATGFPDFSQAENPTGIVGIA